MSFDAAYPCTQRAQHCSKLVPTPNPDSLFAPAQQPRQDSTTAQSPPPKNVVVLVCLPSCERADQLDHRPGADTYPSLAFHSTLIYGLLCSRCMRHSLKSTITSQLCINSQPHQHSNCHIHPSPSNHCVATTSFLPNALHCAAASGTAQRRAACGQSWPRRRRRPKRVARPRSLRLRRWTACGALPFCNLFL
jgi:hypothetical protein